MTLQGAAAGPPRSARTVSPLGAPTDVVRPTGRVVGRPPRKTKSGQRTTDRGSAAAGAVLAFGWLLAVAMAWSLEASLHYASPTWAHALPFLLPIGYLLVLHAYALRRGWERMLIGFWVTAAVGLVAALALGFYVASFTN